MNNNVFTSMNRNVRFIGSLDSAKTSHPIPSASEVDNWWMTSNKDSHLLHCAAAEVIAIKQVLMGEILQLPRNQSFDSPAWFNLGDHFVKSEIPLFSICVIGKSATPDAFLIDCSEQFEPSTPFALSAWPGLTDDQRSLIARNIKTQGNFKDMFKDFKVDSDWKSTFEFQQSVLQRVLEYLTDNYKEKPQLIRAVEYAPTTTWHRIERDYQEPQFVEKMKNKYGKDLASEFCSVLNEIKNKARRDIGEPKQILRWLSSRTNLYKEIYHQPHKLREILRAEIDRCYVETTSESLTNIGRFSDADRSDTERSVSERFHDSILEDANNDPDGLREYYVINFEHLKSQQNSINSFLEILNDEKFAERIKNLRRIRSWTEVDSHHIIELEQEHLQALCQELPNVVIKQDQKPFRIFWRTGQLVTIFIPIGPIITTVVAVLDYLKDIAAESDNKSVKDVLNKTKVLDGFEELISKKQQVSLAGILRDWLTKPIKVDEGKSQ